MFREYVLGQQLSEVYKNFDYKLGDVYAYTTDIDRTKTSLRMALNGLFHTMESQIVDSISIHYKPTGTEFLSTIASSK